MPLPNAEILSRACEYPYSFPLKSYLFRSRTPDILFNFVGTDTQGRTPVLAFGSNQSPLRLAQKFGHDESHIIPVERAVLSDFDVGYSAHITNYGAVPAMLQHAPKTQITVAITWLDNKQLQIMHASEIKAANYHFAALEDVKLTHENGHQSDIAYAYIGTRGQLTKDGLGISLSAIKCEGRKAHSMTTRQALGYIHQQLKPNLDFESFIIKLIEDIDFRHSITDVLSKSSLPFNYNYRIIK